MAARAADGPCWGRRAGTARDRHRPTSIPRPTVVHDAVTTWCAAGEQARADGFEHWPPEPPAPSTAKRLPAPGKRQSNRSASAYLMPDCAGVVVKDWTTGERFTYWADRQYEPNPIERHQNAQAARERQAKAKAAQDERHRLGTLSARTAWLAATPCAEHPYMRSKGETLPGCRVDADGWLLVPRIDVDGNLIGLQRIAPQDGGL